MRAGAVAGIHGMLGKHQQAVFGRLCIQSAKGLLQVLVDGQRALLARLILDAGDHSAIRVDEVYALHAIDGRQLLKIFPERRT